MCSYEEENIYNSTANNTGKGRDVDFKSADFFGLFLFGTYYEYFTDSIWCWETQLTVAPSGGVQCLITKQTSTVLQCTYCTPWRCKKQVYLHGITISTISNEQYAIFRIFQKWTMSSYFRICKLFYIQKIILKMSLFRIPQSSIFRKWKQRIWLCVLCTFFILLTVSTFNNNLIKWLVILNYVQLP